MLKNRHVSDGTGEIVLKTLNAGNKEKRRNIPELLLEHDYKYKSRGLKGMTEARQMEADDIISYSFSCFFMILRCIYCKWNT